jgi:hypothetical protein
MAGSCDFDNGRLGSINDVESLALTGRLLGFQTGLSSSLWIA